MSILKGTEPGPGSTRYFNYRSATRSLIAGFSLVTSVNIVNGSELSDALISGTTQGGYTFITSGFYMRLCEWLAVRQADRHVSLLLGTLIPATLNFAGSYGLQELVNAPNPLESSLIPLLFNVPLYALHASRFQRERTIDMVASDNMLDKTWYFLVRKEWLSRKSKDKSYTSLN